ncbi:MAG: RNA polymerase sigma factor [Saprospiraceae bacterium]
MQTSAKDITDQDILNLLQNDKDAEKGFRMLMQKYQERLYWHVRRMVTEHDDANDVIQNTFIKVYKSIQRFEGKSKLYTWLYRIATNEAITFLNKRKRKQTEALDDETNRINRLESDPYFDGERATMLLHQALEQLPEKQKIVFNLRYFDEMSYKEMEKVLETSVGALKASFHHALKKVQAYLKEQSE